jgi:electron-transferring-flavoprotein dehydrogenase
MSQPKRDEMQADIVCVGFGPATAGFLSTLSGALMNEDGTPRLESQVMPGIPMQILCYERSDDLGFGVSGVVTKGEAIKKSFPNLNPNDIPMATPVRTEKMVYLLDPIGASNRSGVHRFGDKLLKTFRGILPLQHEAMEIPFIPSAMQKHDGFIFSIGQFSQWVGSQLLSTGMIQLWPGVPVEKPLIQDDRVEGVQLVDQGTDRQGNPEAGFLPGMNIKANLTVVGDGPVGPVGMQLDETFGMPDDHERKDWAVGAKMVIDLPENSGLEAGTVIHTLGYPEPDIFGFLYVHPDNVASLGIFVPSWFDSPVRSTYRYLQHWMQHPYLWRFLQGGTLRSWGAKTIQESGLRGEPFLSGHGWARIGEGSGSTNIFANSGVDEAWHTGVLLAQAVETLALSGKPFTRENLKETYVKQRKASTLQKEAERAEGSRDGFQHGFVPGMIGMGLSWLSGGKLRYPAKPRATFERIQDPKRYFRGRVSKERLDDIKKESRVKETAMSDAVMDELGWPAIPYDGQLLVSHQDALYMGGKVQAPAGYKDHVVFVYPHLCEQCEAKVCIEICSGQAITPGENGIPDFDREKCIHCGACYWNCTQLADPEQEQTNIKFRAGAGGLHSSEN